MAETKPAVWLVSKERPACGSVQRDAMVQYLRGCNLEGGGWPRVLSTSDAEIQVFSKFTHLELGQFGNPGL